ncbi:MAG: GAF domain-containing protein, partial [Armatimonadetes bacterium]|nr:GAF domain-containing protein [Armatimonadota bacterium]
IDSPGSLVQVPLVGDGERTIGRLTLLSPLPAQAFGGDDREELAALGAQAGAAWETAWLRHSLSRQSEDLNRSAGELSALVEASRALVSLDQHDVLDEILGRAIGLVAAERGSLMLLDEDGQELRIETARGLPGSIVENTRQRVGEGFAGKVAATGQPLRLTDTLEPGIVRAGVKDAMCVPLRIQDHIIGVLNISNKTGPEQFSDRDMDVLSALANQAAIAIQNARLFGDLQELLLSTISTLAKAVDAKDRYTAGHSHRVTLYALEIGRELGLDAADLDLLRIGALMHDVGKIGVSEQILRKPGPLTEPEREEMRRHPLYGARIVEPIRQLHPILPAVRWHHERYDGGGYPDGLAGDEIPVMARILMVADAYDAMTSDRPYRRSLADQVALQEFHDGLRRQWHPDAVEAFLRAHQAGRIEPIKGAMPEA